MPGLPQEIVTGAREPHHTGQVAKPLYQTDSVEPARTVQLREGQVQFHARSRRYRVDFKTPNKIMSQTTGELMDPTPLFLQFDDRSAITDNLDIIHRAKGCVAAGAVKCAKHPKCVVDCVEKRCEQGHITAAGKPWPAHPSYGLKAEFWDASEMTEAIRISTKANRIAQALQLKETLPPEELKEFLTALGTDTFKLPDKKE